jgi:hypothetical protein
VELGPAQLQRVRPGRRAPSLARPCAQRMHRRRALRRWRAATASVRHLPLFVPAPSLPARWCSLLIEVALKSRQDLVGTVAAMVAPQLQLGASADVVTLEVPLEGVEPFVFALVANRDRKAVLEARRDVAKFTSKAFAGSTLGLPEALEVLTESRDIADALLTPQLVRLVTANRRVFKSLHITDHADMAGFTTRRMGQHAVRLQLELPPAAAYEKELLPFVAYLCDLVDRLAALKLSKEVRGTDGLAGFRARPLPRLAYRPYRCVRRAAALRRRAAPGVGRGAPSHAAWLPGCMACRPRTR